MLIRSKMAETRAIKDALTKHYAQEMVDFKFDFDLPEGIEAPSS